MSRVAVPSVSVAVAACVAFAWAPGAWAGVHDALIAKHAAENSVPEPLVRRVIRIESHGRARIVHKGNYGLMQIRLGTARSLGYAGDAEGLLDPDTNLTYAVKYLAGAYRAAGCDADRAVAYYKRGYHGVKRTDCGTSGIAVAQSDTDAAKSVSAGRKREVASAPIDVIKPRVVQTELISKSKTDVVPAPRPSKFEPVRMSAVSFAGLRAVPLPSPKPAALLTKPELAASTAVAALVTDTSDIVPLPRVRPELAALPAVAALETEPVDAAPPPRVRPKPRADVQPGHRAERKHRHAGKEQARASKKAEDAIDVPGAVVSLWKKLTTPDRKSRRQANREPAQAPSPPQNF